MVACIRNHPARTALEVTGRRCLAGLGVWLCCDQAEGGPVPLLVTTGCGALTTHAQAWEALRGKRPSF